MTCAELEDRLFDEDCRAALLGTAVVPADVAEHADRCPACAEQWAEAVAGTRQLRGRLVVAPPPVLLGRLYRAFRPRSGARTLPVDAEALSWGIAGGALGAALAGAALAPGPREWAGFCVGASLALALVALRGARRAWLAPWGVLCGEASRRIARLVRVV